MSPSIRIGSGLGLILQHGSGLGPILQHIPNASSSSCMFLHTEVSFPINLSSTKECRKRALVVSKRNPCAAATMKSSNVVVDEDDTSNNEGKYDIDPLKVVLFGVSQVWGWILSNIQSRFCYEEVTMGDVALMVLMDRRDPIDGLGVLLDVSQTWRRVLSVAAGDDELFDPKEFDDHYSSSYLRKARMDGGTNKGKPNKISPSSISSRIISRLSVIRVLADLKDPNDSLEILSGALELWRKKFSSNELNDSEGYLQKEIFALRDLSQRISVYNRNGNNPPSLITHLVELYKLQIDNFEDPKDAAKARKEAFRCYVEDVECDGVLGLMVDVFAKLCYCQKKQRIAKQKKAEQKKAEQNDNDGYFSEDILAIPDSSEEDP